MSAGIAGIGVRMQEINRMIVGLVPKAAEPAATSGTEFASALTSALSGTTATSGASTSGGVSGGQVVENAKQYLGVPYVWGGTDPAKGLDCSGLVQLVYKNLGITLPRVAEDQAQQGAAVPSLDQAKPGDLVTFGNPAYHIGIYTGDGKMIHAPEPGAQVREQKIWETPTSIRRIVPEASASAVSASGSVARPAALSGGAATYESAFAAATAKYGLPQGLLSAVASVESNYNPTAVSSAGAQGLMQIMPATAAGLGVNALDPMQAIDGAARLLSGNLKSFNGSLPLAIAAYNAGSGAVQKYGGIPPFAETQNYVPKVQAAMARLNGGA
ncbi:transglycosylase SLT domain-containing protein [Actinosynnema pretiosum subsp. pretiosum]|uniref:Transglycosylase SLT domain-containing protein n=1 Tax=Actinosynnema pretiosum subsp. pretiosum TaxID=103721 RepID=A0AA45R5K5_9PSEU|nr:Membrane-bound lytic murein transglycosylase D precursor [Actinosynnema pretiosum subsp. pretiosum]QUF06047.1 transglycosylase SLT domain-containing protein [Actinosynnema pretiosum subsp. pretiosum]